MRASHDRQIFETVCRFVKVKFGMNKTQGILDLEDVPVGALYWDSVLWLPSKELLRRFKLNRRIRVSESLSSLGIEFIGPNDLKMRAIGPSWSGICPVLQF